MKNDNFRYLNNEKVKEENIIEDTISEETDEEIIDNNWIDEDDDEYIEKKEEKSPIKENEEEEDEEEEENIQKENRNYLNIKEEKNDERLIKNNIKKNRKNNYNNNNKNIEINKKPQKNKFQTYYSPKFDFARRKHKKNEEKNNADELFLKAIEKNKIKNESNKEYDQEGNTLSTKVTDILYDKYIGQNGRKLKTIDVISKMKDEEIRVNREALRTKDDAKKITEMINRQEDFEKQKINKLKEKEKEINDKVSQECVFMPNGIINSTRTPADFYNSQLQFIEKKEDKINQIYQNILDKENKNMNLILTSKISDKIVSVKNPNESKEEFCKRLHYEKLKKGKESLEKPKEEKKLTKEQIKNLSDKLYKEGQTFRDNKNKKQKEKILKDMNSNKEEFISEKTNKVLLNKFISYYEKILLETFNRNDNFQICLDEYKLILNNMGCINPNSQIDEELVKESFYKYLKPVEEKIDTHAFLVFGLTALGIYKGNDEVRKQKVNSSINANNYINNRTIEPQKNNNKLNNSRKTNNTLQKLKTSGELIKTSLPNLDLNKYGYNNKTTKIIKQKFLPFIKGLNGSWIGDITKKKQERREKLEETKKKNEYKKINKNIKLNKSENNKLEVTYKIIQQKKENDLRTLRAKKEAEELALCTFQPNVNRSNNINKNINKKQIEKNIEKLYQEGKAAYIQKKNIIEHDPEDNDENKINCTFKPVINQYNNEMFSRNPLKEDLLRFEKIREQKLSHNFKEYEKPMNFAIESKISKEDIVDRIIPTKNYNKENYDDEREDIPPLLKVEVNLDEKNNTDKIIIYPGDNIREKTIQFCIKHKLNEEKKNTLLNIILEKMKENKENEEENKEENENDELYENKEVENENDELYENKKEENKNDELYENKEVENENDELYENKEEENDNDELYEKKEEENDNDELYENKEVENENDELYENKEEENNDKDNNNNEIEEKNDLNNEENKKEEHMDNNEEIRDNQIKENNNENKNDKSYEEVDSEN